MRKRERDEYVKVPKVKCDFINLLFDYIVTFSIQGQLMQGIAFFEADEIVF